MRKGNIYWVYRNMGRVTRYDVIAMDTSGNIKEKVTNRDKK